MTKAKNCYGNSVLCQGLGASPTCRKNFQSVPRKLWKLFLVLYKDGFCRIIKGARRKIKQISQLVTGQIISCYRLAFLFYTISLYRPCTLSPLPSATRCNHLRLLGGWGVCYCSPNKKPSGGYQRACVSNLYLSVAKPVILCYNASCCVPPADWR